MKFKIHTVAASITLLGMTSGCSTMHFNNGDVPSSPTTQSEWHHNAVASLVEVSSPVDLKSRCNGNNWSEVTTETSFVNGLAGAVGNGILLGLPVWNPMTVEYTCSK